VKSKGRKRSRAQSCLKLKGIDPFKKTLRTEDTKTGVRGKSYDVDEPCVFLGGIGEPVAYVQALKLTEGWVQNSGLRNARSRNER